MLHSWERYFPPSTRRVFMVTSRFLSDLVYFESVDLLRRRFEENHSRVLSSGKGREIASHFRQGREFFETARHAPLLVKPLLLYYAVLSWARGLILFQDPRLRESALKKAHGLAACDWQRALSGGMRSIGDLLIRVEPGTFSQLTSATRNVQSFRGGGANPLLERGAEEVLPGTLLTARDVWARIPRLAAAFEVTFEEPAYLYRGSEALTAAEGSQLFLRPFSPLARPLEPEEIHNRLQLPANVGVRRSSWSKGYEYALTLRSSDGFEWGGLLWGSDSTVVAPFAGGLRLSNLSTLFISAYILGMLVRYHPTRWADLVHRGDGDVALPLVREATQSIQSDFPRALSEALQTPSFWLALTDPAGNLEPGPSGGDFSPPAQ